jgi:hypothetical protein
MYLHAVFWPSQTIGARQDRAKPSPKLLQKNIAQYVF